MSLTGPPTGSQTHTFKPRLIFIDLVLKVVDLALEEVNLLIEGEEDVLHVGERSMKLQKNSYAHTRSI